MDNKHFYNTSKFSQKQNFSNFFLFVTNFGMRIVSFIRDYFIFDVIYSEQVSKQISDYILRCIKIVQIIKRQFGKLPLFSMLVETKSNCQKKFKFKISNLFTFCLYYYILNLVFGSFLLLNYEFSSFEFIRYIWFLIFNLQFIQIFISQMGDSLNSYILISMDHIEPFIYALTSVSIFLYKFLNFNFFISTNLFNILTLVFFNIRISLGLYILYFYYDAQITNIIELKDSLTEDFSYVISRIHKPFFNYFNNYFIIEISYFLGIIKFTSQMELSRYIAHTLANVYLPFAQKKLVHHNLISLKENDSNFFKLTFNDVMKTTGKKIAEMSLVGFIFSFFYYFNNIKVFNIFNVFSKENLLSNQNKIFLVIFTMFCEHFFVFPNIIGDMYGSLLSKRGNFNGCGRYFSNQVLPYFFSFFISAFSYFIFRIFSFKPSVFYSIVIWCLIKMLSQTLETLLIMYNMRQYLDLDIFNYFFSSLFNDIFVILQNCYYFIQEFFYSIRYFYYIVIFMYCFFRDIFNEKYIYDKLNYFIKLIFSDRLYYRILSKYDFLETLKHNESYFFKGLFEIFYSAAKFIEYLVPYIFKTAFQLTFAIMFSFGSGFYIYLPFSILRAFAKELDVMFPMVHVNDLTLFQNIIYFLPLVYPFYIFLNLYRQLRQDNLIEEIFVLERFLVYFESSVKFEEKNNEYFIDSSSYSKEEVSSMIELYEKR